VYFFFGHCRQVRKVKPKLVGSYQRTTLLDLLTEHLAEGELKQMGSRMVAGDIESSFFIHNRLYRITN